MTYFGTVAHMINSLKYNNSLLKRPKAFSKLKKYIQQQTDYHKKIQLKEVDAEELKRIKAEVKRKLQAERRRNDFILISIALTTFVSIGLILYMTVLIPRPEYRYSDSYSKALEEKVREEKKAREKFEYYITDGYKWLKKNDFYNALYQFELAVKNQPDNFDANLGLTLTLLKKCHFTNEDCERADKQLDIVLNKFIESPQLSEQISEYLYSIGDTLGAERLSIK